MLATKRFGTDNMKFSSKRPNREGYYWYQKTGHYAPVIGRLSQYSAGSGREGKWLVVDAFSSDDAFEDHMLTGKELWGTRIKEP